MDKKAKDKKKEEKLILWGSGIFLAVLLAHWLGVPYVLYFFPFLLIVFALAIPILCFIDQRGLAMKLATVPLTLSLCYSLLAVTVIRVSSKIIPAEWEWPVGHNARALLLLTGEWAVAHETSGRIQIYGGDNRYRRGWYVREARGKFEIAQVFPQEQLGVREAIVVKYPGDSRFRYYDPSGKLLLESDRQVVAVTGSVYAHKNFAGTSWYAWPLVHEGYAIGLFFVGGVGLSVLQQRGKKARLQSK